MCGRSEGSTLLSLHILQVFTNLTVHVEEHCEKSIECIMITSTLDNSVYYLSRDYHQFLLAWQ